MPSSSDRGEMILLLARAFDRAWNGYYRPGRMVTVPAEVARKALAVFLIASAKEGVCDEDVLAQGGVEHLISITPAPWGSIRLEKPGAKFVRTWRVRIDHLRRPND
jgi:hypothetical protein